jgi:hypothetical protein
LEDDLFSKLTPSLFEDLDAADEASFCVELGAKVKQKHWQIFIARGNFA